jgi:ABC-2 type transport system permease protein
MTISLGRTAAIFLRQFYLVRGSVARFLPLFVWVTVDMTLWGFMSRYLNHVASPGYNFVPALLGSVLLWDFFIRVMQGVTMAFFEDVWSRNFLNIFATPLSISEYIGGLVLSSIATSSVGLAVMLVLSTTVFGLSFFVYGALLAPFILVLFLFGIALGTLGISVVMRYGPAAEWFVWPIPALVSPFAGVFYPIATLPSWMQAISRLLPPSYVFESIRQILAHGSAPGGMLVWAVVLAAIDVLLACWVFTRTYRFAVRTGLLARYSAEAV